MTLSGPGRLSIQHCLLLQIVTGFGMLLMQDDLTKQCAAVGLPKSKRTKDQLANSLLSAMDSGNSSSQHSRSHALHVFSSS